MDSRAVLQVAATCNYHHRPHPSNTLASQQYLGLGLDFSVGKFGQLTKFQQVYIGGEGNEKVYDWSVMPAGCGVTCVSSLLSVRYLLMISAAVSRHLAEKYSTVHLYERTVQYMNVQYSS